MYNKIFYHYLTARGIAKYEKVGEDGEFIFVKCLACNDQKHPCIVKLNNVDGSKNKWKYVSMLQSCSDDVYENSDGEERNTAYIWHNDSYFFEKRSDCMESTWKSTIDSYKDEIEKIEKQLKNKKESLERIEKMVEDTFAEEKSL